MNKMWQKIEATRRIYERKYFSAFRKMLKKQIEPLVEYLRTQDITVFKEVAEILIDETMPEKLMIELFREVGYEFIKLTPGLVKKADGEMERAFWYDELERIVREDTAMSIRLASITNTNKENILRMVKKYVDEGFSQGQGIEEITRNIFKNINSEISDFTRWQAKRIAQTEVIGASNKATYEAGKILDVPVNKVWLTAPLGLAKHERHTIPGAVENYEVAMNQNFLVDGGNGYAPMKHPGDPSGGAENVINCRCAMAYRTLN